MSLVIGNNFQTDKGSFEKVQADLIELADFPLVITTGTGEVKYIPWWKNLPRGQTHTGIGKVLWDLIDRPYPVTVYYQKVLPEPSQTQGRHTYMQEPGIATPWGALIYATQQSSVKEMDIYYRNVMDINGVEQEFCITVDNCVKSLYSCGNNWHVEPEERAIILLQMLYLASFAGGDVDYSVDTSRYWPTLVFDLENEWRRIYNRRYCRVNTNVQMGCVYVEGRGLIATTARHVHASLHALRASVAASRQPEHKTPNLRTSGRSLR